MQGLLDTALANPWATLDTLLDGPLHPGGTAATEQLLDRAAVSEGTRLLDVGCGTGDALALARKRGARAWGVDPTPETVRAVRGDATVLPVPDGRVDVVLAECILCLTDRSAALTEARRVLGDGGRLALSDVVVAGDTPELPDQVATALCLTGERSRDELVASVEQAGFTVEDEQDHREELLAMREEVTDRVDYQGLLGAMGDRGEAVAAGLADLETMLDDGRLGYVSIVASS